MYVTSPVNYFENAQPIPAWSEDVAPEFSCEKTIHMGHHLFCEGDDADFVYKVIEGVVRTSKVFIDGRRQVMAFGYPGDIVGLSHDGLYHNDCDAINEVKVRIYRKNTFNMSFDDEPEFCGQMLKHAATEMNDMQEHFMMLGRKNALEKVASFLVVLLDRVGEKHDCTTCFDLPMSRSDIADFLGLTIETVSRSLTILRKQGVIDLPNPHRVCVCKSSVLRDLGENDL